MHYTQTYTLAPLTISCELMFAAGEWVTADWKGVKAKHLSEQDARDYFAHLCSQFDKEMTKVTSILELEPPRKHITIKCGNILLELCQGTTIKETWLVAFEGHGYRFERDNRPKFATFDSAYTFFQDLEREVVDLETFKATIKPEMSRLMVPINNRLSGIENRLQFEKKQIGA